MQGGKLVARERRMKMNVYSIAVRERKIEFDLKCDWKNWIYCATGK